MEMVHNGGFELALATVNLTQGRILPAKSKGVIAPWQGVYVKRK